MTKPSAITPAAAYPKGARSRLIVIASVVPAAIAMVGALLMVLWAPELPDPIAVHWGASGAPDGYGAVGEMIALLLGCVLIFSAGVTVGLLRTKAAAHSSPPIRVMSATSVWLSAFLTIGIAGSVGVQRGLADASEAGSVLPVLLLGAVVGLLLAPAAWFLTPLPMTEEAMEDEVIAALNLAPEERASWTRSARPSTKTVVLYFSLVGGVLLATVLLMARTNAPWASWYLVLLGLGLVLVASAVCFFWHVSVDQRGVTVRSGVGFPRLSIPLDDIRETRVIDVNPFGGFGGWGWRWTGGRTGIVVRAGEALEIIRTSGKVLVVTVDDAATAVALLDGLLSRRALPAPHRR
jgi:hypothetical protein